MTVDCIIAGSFAKKPKSFVMKDTITIESILSDNFAEAVSIAQAGGYADMRINLYKY